MDTTLKTAFRVTGDILPPDRAKQFEALYSQTSMHEREALYAVARHAYTGEGEILDIGTAAGGSTYCLAAGVLDSDLTDKSGRVHGYDLFAGFSLGAFAERLAKEGHRFDSDLELFDWQTRDVAPAIIRTAADLTANPSVLNVGRKVEIAHIDAAKSLPLWKVIFAALAPAVIPGKTIWIFQDFEVISLPWHIYSLGEMLKVGQLIGGARYGTMFFRFDATVPAAMTAKIASDDFTLSEKIANVDAVYDIIERDFPQIFAGSLAFDDLRNGTKAYCHNMAGDLDTARRLFVPMSEGFRSHPGMRGHIAKFG